MKNLRGKNATLINPITNEEIPCKIRARLRFANGVSEYLNLHHLPKKSTIGKLVGRADSTPFYRQRVQPHSAYLKNFPYILVNHDEDTKTPVVFTSCQYRGTDFCHIRVRIITDGLKFSEMVEERRNIICQTPVHA